MRCYFLGLLILTFLSCKKSNERPECRFKRITHRSGFSYPVSYSGDTLMVLGANSTGSNLYFSTSGKLLRIESPVTDPYILTELVYDNKGKVAESKSSFKIGNNWVYQNKMVFTYTNNKIINIREENASYPSGPYYTTALVWEGNNIRTVINYAGADTSCIKTFSYDLSKTNPMTRNSFLYFADGDASYGGYKLPLYFSKNLVTKVETKCPTPETRIYSYMFNSDGLIEKMLDNSDTLWAYEYNCQ